MSVIGKTVMFPFNKSQVREYTYTYCTSLNIKLDDNYIAIYRVGDIMIAPFKDNPLFSYQVGYSYIPIHIALLCPYYGPFYPH
jgi:hypothetical protein